MTEAEQLYNTVIKNGYCIGCGACATVKDSPFEMVWDIVKGMYVAQPKEDLSLSHSSVLQICPFSDKAKSETQIANEIFNNNPNKSKFIGNFNGY